MSTARKIRDRVEQAGGRLEMSVRELRDAFGVSRLTASARQRITQELRRAKLRLEPPLEGLKLNEHITIVDARRRASKAPPPTPPPPAQRPEASDTTRPDDPWKEATARFASGTAVTGGASQGISKRPWSRRRGVAAGVGLGLVIILLVAVFGSGGDETKEPSAALAPDPVAQETSQGRSEALDYLNQASAAIAADDPASARSFLAEIDEDVIAEDPSLARRLTRARQLARLTERYVAATELADLGSYLPARREMLAIAPFRNAKARAGSYATLAARDLVTQARGVYESRPGRALGLLDRAEDLAPSLAVIDTVRSLATSRQQALAAPPPAPTPPPAPVVPAEPSCDPNYTGACIPNVGYDLDCDEVAASDFGSVGSDPHGFDREGDGLACES